MTQSSTPRTRLRPDERRRQILAAAHEAFRDTEYSAVSLDDLARAAGVTRGLLHHYFGSKRALYLAVVRQTAELAASLPLAPDDVDGPLEVVLDACVARWLDGAASAGGLWVQGTASFVLGTDDVEAVVTEARDLLVERMIDELPLPDDIDRSMTRAAFRAFSAFARVTTDDWLVHHTLTRPQTHALLSATLLGLVREAVPRMSAA